MDNRFESINEDLFQPLKTEESLEVTGGAGGSREATVETTYGPGGVDGKAEVKWDF